MDDQDLITVAGITARALRELAATLEDEIAAVDEQPFIVDLVGQLATNRSPDHIYLVQRGWSWWRLRKSEEVTGITIHHTLSHSPEATAAYCSRPVSQGGKGYPSIQYHYWVSAGDECTIYKCAPVSWALWHDHTGANPTTISIGMAGHLHTHKPPAEQIDATARLVRWLMDSLGLEEDQVQGHTDRYAGTICPGWYRARWKGDFFEALRGT